MFSRHHSQPAKINLAALVVAVTAALFVGGLSPARADDPTGKDLQLTNPLDGATIREVVPVQIPAATLPSDGGYASISIDGVFRLATAITPGSNTVWTWDTKAPFAAPGSDATMYTKDGDHTITVKIFNHNNEIFGTASAKVHIANNISSQGLADGVKLVYRWAKYPEQRFQLTSKLESNNSASGLPSETLQSAKIEFVRTAEDDDGTGQSFRIVDKVLPGGIIYSRATAAYVEQAYNLKGKSRTVDGYGFTIRNELPISSGSHFGFDIAQFSRRRIQVGDAWETLIPITLQWAVEKPTVVRGSARLDAFEWEDHYPTAKIVENYEGPATLNIEGSGDTAIPAAPNVNIKLTRTVWFAYGLGRVVRESTDMKVDGFFTATQAGAIGANGLNNPSSGAGSSQSTERAPNPFAPIGGRNSAGNFGSTPGASQNTGQAFSQLSFHVAQDMVAEVKSD